MTFFVWCNADQYGFRISSTRPMVADVDEPLCRRKKGDIVSDIDTVVSIIPEGFEQFLPPVGEVREAKFHEDLWGKAQELPSYDKKHWVSLASMVGA